jgi:ribosomal protein S18 acetylase RimI-like enzyme
MIITTPSLRRVQPGDEPLLFQIYASTRLAELAALGWSAAEQATFLRQQFDTQDQHYREHYAGADFQIILLGDHPIGRLYIARWPDEIRLIDIALLPERRNAGVGSWLIGGLLNEAALAGRPMRLHVEPCNPALRLYQRLGFTKIADHGLHWVMEWASGRGDGRPVAPISGGCYAGLNYR